MVDSSRIGVLGVCGWGSCYTFSPGYREEVKAVVSATMGVFDTFTSGKERLAGRRALNEIRSRQAQGEAVPVLITVPDITVDSPDYMKDYYGYYRTF